MPDEMRAVHIAVDRHAAELLADEWRALGLSRVPLELVDCPDRRVDARRARGGRARRLATARPRSRVLLPHRLYKRFWHRLLHDNTGDEIARVVGQLPHANVTMVPFHMGSGAPPPIEIPMVGTSAFDGPPSDPGGE